MSRRYRFSKLRLTKLNWAVRFGQPTYRREPGRLGHCYYHMLHRGTGEFVEAAIVPFMFVFAVASVVLSAMQVMLAASASSTPGHVLESAS